MIAAIAARAPKIFQKRSPRRAKAAAAAEADRSDEATPSSLAHAVQLAASLEALDAAYRDGEEEALDFSDELAELLDDGGAEEDAAEPVAERKAATAHAYGRATALGRSHFPQLLDALDGVPDLGPRHVALLEQAPDTRTAPHSDLQAYTATLYVLVAGSGGVVVDAIGCRVARGVRLGRRVVLRLRGADVRMRVCSTLLLHGHAVDAARD